MARLIGKSTAVTKKRGKAFSEPDWETESDMNTLKRHAEIVADPTRHARAHALAQKQVEALRHISKPRVKRT